MRLIIFLFAILGFAVPAHAQEVWSRAQDRITLNQARISFPLRADRLAFAESKEFSHPGESLDAVVQYQSPDEKVFATVYVYYPGISHAGLAAYATDNAIRSNSQDGVNRTGSQVVAAGGHAGVAVRADYSGYRGNLVSSAAFIKAGRWMVKLRVSGPEDRRAEVMGTMSALLDGVRFDGEARPRPAALLEMTTCPSPANSDAGLAADDGIDVAALALAIGAVDPAGEPTRNPASEGGEGGALGSRIGSAWCKGTAAQMGMSGGFIPILRTTEPENSNPGLAGKSVAFALYSDAGGLLEVLRLTKGGKYLVLHHQIGSTNILGAFKTVPSDAQIALILAGQSPAGRTRARIRFKANGDSNVELVTPPPAPASPTT